MKFKKGDRVKLVGPGMWTSSPSNPYWDEYKVGGTVKGGGLVLWDNGTENYYGSDYACVVKFEEEKEKKEEDKKKAIVTFESVIIDEEKKTQILAALSQVENIKTIFDKWGFASIFEKGTAISFLFDGGPGTGKTLMAEAIANKIGRPLITVGAAEIESPTPGEAERNIKRYFKMASGKRGRPSGEVNEKTGEPILLEKEKCVLLFDECDSLITNRANVGMILRSQINTLLSEIEQFDGVVVFTTNRKEDLDPAMERRITEKIEFGFPSKEARYLIWKRMIPKECPLDDEVDFEELSRFPIAGGNIKNVVLNAARRAAYAGHKKITYDDFYDAIESELKGVQSFEKAMEKGSVTTSPKGTNHRDVVRSEKGAEVVKE